MSRDRDNQKEKVYRAERETFSEWDEDAATLVDLREAQAYSNKVTSSSLYRNLGGPSFVLVKDGRSRRRAGMVGPTTIALPKWARQEAMVIHELTHVLLHHIDRRAASHGPEFVLLFRRLVEDQLGEDMRQKYDKFAEQHHVRWGVNGSMRLANKLATVA